MTARRILGGAAVLLMAWAGAHLAGCEADSADQRLDISPQTVVLQKGQSQEFVVTGGYVYHWSLSDTSYGRLSSISGERNVYTALQAPATNSTFLQKITVTSTIDGAPSDTTNSPAYSQTIEALVTQIPDPEPDAP